VWLRLHLQTGFSRAHLDSLLLQQSLNMHLIPYFPAGPLLITSHPLFLLKAGLPNAPRLSGFVAGQWRRGVLARWRSDSSSWEIRGRVSRCRLPSALLLRLCGELIRKGRRFLPMGQWTYSFANCTLLLIFLIWVCILPCVHSSALYRWKETWNQMPNFAWCF